MHSLQDVAWLKFTVTTNPLGVRDSLTVDWDGKSPYTYISNLRLDEFNAVTRLIRGRDEIQVGPYRLLKVADELATDMVLYVRKDKFGAIRVRLYKATHLLDLIYRRAIITLAVWKLAEYHPSMIPSWRDIKLLKKFHHG